MLQDGWARPSRDLLDEGLPAGATLERVRRAVLALEPGDDATRRWLRDQALAGSGALLNARWELLERQDLPIRPAFLVVVTSWIALIFLSFGLNAPRNATVVCTFAVCASAIGASIFLVAEMETPFDGLLQAVRHPVEVAPARARIGR